MKAILSVLILASFNVIAMDEGEMIKSVVVKDLEEFSSHYQNQEIKIIEASMRPSLNPLQWLLMVKDLASGETRKVVTFKYRVNEDTDIKQGYLVMTYEQDQEVFESQEDCFRIYINKLNFDTGILNLSGLFPGFKVIRNIEHCP